MAWWIGPSTSSQDVDKYLKNAGFIYDELDVGMVCNLSRIPEILFSPKKLKIRTCKTSKNFADFGKVLASIFDPSDNQLKILYNKMATLNLKESKNMILYIGYENHRPVSTSCLFKTNIAGIYDIATRPEKRKLGYGSAMFYHALIEAKKWVLKKVYFKPLRMDLIFINVLDLKNYINFMFGVIERLK